LVQKFKMEIMKILEKCETASYKFGYRFSNDLGEKARVLDLINKTVPEIMAHSQSGLISALMDAYKDGNYLDLY